MKYKLTAEQISENYNTLIEKIEDTFHGERKTKLLKLFNEIGERFALAPASTRSGFHNAFPGGLLLHTLTVMNICDRMYDIWTEFGANTSLFTKESLLFVALCHDLGKLGNFKDDYYIENDSSWHVTNRQEYYKINPTIVNMKHEHRSLWILNQVGIELNEEEFVSIIAHSGAWNEGNESYFFSFDKEKLPKSCMVFTLSEADIMAYRIEHEQENNPKSNLNKEVQKQKKEEKRSAEQIFDDLFN